MTTRKSIAIIGERGLVSQMLQVAIRSDIITYNVNVISTTQFIEQGPNQIVGDADLVITCVDISKTQQVLDLIPNKKVLDISPTFRCNPNWVYGLEEIVGASNISNSQYVANPGCFATAAILLLEPIIALNYDGACTSFYCDGTGGYTTGGTKMVEKYESLFVPDTIYSLNKPHLHIAEIKKICGIEHQDVVFTPKIANVPRGIRMAIYIPREYKEDRLIDIYEAKYKRFSNIHIDLSGNHGLGKIPVDEMAGKYGAIIRAYDQPENNGTLVVLTMDNMLRGCIEPAMNNIRLMLGN